MKILYFLIVLSLISCCYSWKQTQITWDLDFSNIILDESLEGYSNPLSFSSIILLNLNCNSNYCQKTIQLLTRNCEIKKVTATNNNVTVVIDHVTLKDDILTVYFIKNFDYGSNLDLKIEYSGFVGYNNDDYGFQIKKFYDKK